MANTQLSDAIIPEVYLDYVANDSPEKTAFVEGGIAVTNPVLGQQANSGGNVVEIPHWNDLSTDEPNIGDTTDNDATPYKLTSGKQTARVAYLNNGWATKDLVGEIAGSDPMRRIRDRTDRYWMRSWQKRLLACAEGVQAGNVAANSSDMVNDIAIEDGANATAANLIGRSAVVEAAFTLGDSFGNTGVIALHSAVYKRLVNLDDIDFVADSTGTLNIPSYLGKRVVVDDSMPVIAGGTSGFKYTTMLFGEGAIGYGMGTPNVPVEVDRDPAKGVGSGLETLWERNTWLIHPSGYNFTSTAVASESPTLAELRDATNWTRVFDRKSIPLAFLVTNG